MNLQLRKFVILIQALAVLFMLTVFQNCGKPFQVKDYSSESDQQGQNIGTGSSSCRLEGGYGKLDSTNKCLVVNCNSRGFHPNLATNSCDSNQTTCQVANGSGNSTWENGTWNGCQIQQCDTGFHIDSNTCVPNQRSCIVAGGNGIEVWNGTSWGTCVFSPCTAGNHAEGSVCISNTKSCAVSNGDGQQTWNGTNYGACNPVSCNSGYHIENNACQSNQKTCSVANGSGQQTWNGSRYGLCEAVSCVNNYHVEDKTCASNNRICSSNGTTGTQGWKAGAWTNCSVCEAGYTSWEGTCTANPTLVKQYASYLADCWKDGVIHCASAPIIGHIEVPSRYAARVSDTITFSVKYSGASLVSLNGNHVILLGSATTGCSTTVFGGGTDSRTISISGCSGVGTLRISIAAGSASNSAGQSLGAFGPSTDVIISNTSAIPKVAMGTDILGSYPGALGNQIPFAMYYPSDYSSRQNIPILIWIHGGAWSAGDYTANSEVLRGKAIAEMGFIVINTNYTLAKGNPANYPANYPNVVPPTAPYSIGPDDIKALVKYVSDSAHLFNGDKNRISISGASAGGHLALQQATRFDNTVQFKCVISIAGPTDLVSMRDNSNYPVSSFIVRSVFGTSVSTLQRYSPAYNVASFKANKLAILHQLQDNLVPIDQALQLVARFRESKPNLDMTINYANETNPYPVFKPGFSQVTHVYDDSQIHLDAFKAYVYSQCRD